MAARGGSSLADTREKRDELRSRGSVAELLQARYQYRCVGLGESFLSSRAEREEGCGLSRSPNPPHSLLTHGSRALERVQMKAYGVIRYAQTFSQIINGPRALSQQCEESSAGRVSTGVRRSASQFSHLPSF